ncbi:MAG TPA: pseudouridine synthase [Acidimicrobiia bacterium]|nr:pseudouridine synthase [Acidimicrobiia bacterium]
MAPEREAARDGERLQKVLARAGLGSRRTCEGLIAARRVTVNGEVAVLGRRVDPNADRILVDGILAVARDDVVYYLLNKPPRTVTTAKDPQGRPTVVELVPLEPRVFPIGRLDFDTEGLLILTNDGELANLLAHPSHGIEKEYLAEVDGVPSRDAIRQLREGVELDDGPTAPAKAHLVQDRGASAAVELTIHEGRNRQVRRMLDAVGHPARRLVRTRIGPIADRSLDPGQWRPLTRAEVRSLYAEVGDPEGRGSDNPSG